MIDIIVQLALARNRRIFFKSRVPKSSGHIIAFDESQGYLVERNAYDKCVYVTLDKSYKVTVDADRLFIMPSDEWSAQETIVNP